MAEKNEKRNQPVRIQMYWTLNTSTKVHGKYPCQDGSFLWYLGQQWGWYLWQVEFWWFISIVISMSFWDFSISFLKKRSHHTQANYTNLPKCHPHKALGDPGLPLRQVQRQSALMHHQNPKHHKWYVDPGWSPPGFFMLQLELRGQKSVDLHPSVYDTSCFEAAKGAASWATRWRTDDKINQANLQMIQCKPAKCSLFFSRKDTHLWRGLVDICFCPGPPKDSWFQLS